MRSFSILDLLAVTALAATHLAAFSVEATPSGSDWPILLRLTPTAITCLIHLRLQMRIPAAIAVHYIATLAWVFVHACGSNFALNAHNRANPSPERDYQLLIFSNAWNDVLEMAIWAIPLAAAYGAVAYTAVRAALNRPVVGNSSLEPGIGG